MAKNEKINTNLPIEDYTCNYHILVCLNIVKLNNGNERKRKEKRVYIRLFLPLMHFPSMFYKGAFLFP